MQGTSPWYSAHSLLLFRPPCSFFFIPQGTFQKQSVVSAVLTRLWTLCGILLIGCSFIIPALIECVCVCVSQRVSVKGPSLTRRPNLWTHFNTSARHTVGQSARTCCVVAANTFNLRTFIKLSQLQLCRKHASLNLTFFGSFLSHESFKNNTGNRKQIYIFFKVTFKISFKSIQFLVCTT